MSQYPGEHDAIITREQWDHVQAILAQDQHSRAGRTRLQAPSLLKGIIRCGHCDTSMGMTYTQKAGKQYRYYLCNHASKFGYSTCPVKSIPAGEIEQAVVAQLRRFSESASEIDPPSAPNRDPPLRAQQRSC